MDAPNEELARLFEGAPRFVARLAAEPVESWSGLLDRAERIALTMPEDEQLELLDAHPRIGANPTGVSEMSFREQGYDHDPGTVELQERLDRLNAEYEQRFGFRFVVFVNGRSRDAIADVMESHMDADRDEEKRRALSDVVAIARHRLANLGNQARQ
jgi:2-oxo-4-hydroxy-4-carboxy--5-ureidoimidazoline (OHCU) decarboxylase